MNNDLIKEWNQFVAEHGPKSGAFLQSWEWGEFQETIGRQVLRFHMKGNQLKPVIASPDRDRDVAISSVASSEIAARPPVARNDEIDGLIQIIKMPLPLGKSYLYIPRGPILISDFPPTGDHPQGDKFQISNFLNQMQDIAKKEGAIFTKIELPIEKQLFEQINLQPTTYNLQPKSTQPRDTLILDLSKSEDELLRDMHEKTRYNIRLAEKKGVQIRWSIPETLEKDIEIFWKLAEKTAARDKFSYHPKKYYKKMLSPSILPLIKGEERGGGENLAMKLIIAEKNGEPLGANIITFFGNTATYLHGASNHEHRELMAPHLLQWRAIQEAKRLSYRYYDFWGIMPMNQELRIRNYATGEDGGKHPWAGITRFKLGFGGEQVHYAPTLDLPVSNFWYNLYRLAKSMRP